MSDTKQPPQDPSKITGQEIVAYLKKTAQEQLNLTPAELAKVDLEFPIVEGLQLDSLAQVTLISAIEDDFGIVLELEDREQIRTVQDLVRLIQERSVKC
jgi:acyl carrier protein